MALVIKNINLQHYINCYLLKTSRGNILIDPLGDLKLKKFEHILHNHQCQAKRINIIILTSKDEKSPKLYSYLNLKHNTPIAIHSSNAEQENKKKKKGLIESGLQKLGIKIKPEYHRFMIDEGFNLCSYGISARIVNLSKYIKGSLGILTANGDLFCGNLFMNIHKPQLNHSIQNIEMAQSILNKMKSLYVNMIYPKIGKPFNFSKLFS